MRRRRSAVRHAVVARRRRDVARRGLRGARRVCRRARVHADQCGGGEGDCGAEGWASLVPRIRTIKPEIIEDEKVGVLSDTAFRLFTSMITLADDHGNVRADVRWLTAQIWWAHKPPPNVLRALIELTSATLIDAYGVRGGTYAHLRGWGKHQRIDNAGKGRVPAPNDADAVAFSSDFEALKVESPRNSANRGEMRLDPDQDQDPERDQDREPAAGRGVTKPKAANRAVRLPADWAPRAEERSMAGDLGLDCDGDAAHFCDHHAAKGSRFTDWHAAFRNWLRNSEKFSRGRRPVASDGLAYAVAVGRGEIP